MHQTVSVSDSNSEEQEDITTSFRDTFMQLKSGQLDTNTGINLLVRARIKKGIVVNKY